MLPDYSAIKNATGGFLPNYGDVFRCPSFHTICCFIRKCDHIAAGEGFSDYDVDRIPDDVFIFLDQGELQWCSDLQIRGTIALTGPLTEDEIDLERMINPHVDFSPWLELYKREKNEH